MSQTILIVDDFASVRLYHTSFLARKGYTCLGAASGAEALALLAQQRVDLILLDLLMPGMTGADFLAKVDEIPGCAQVPVLVITSEERLARDAFRRVRRSLGVLEKPVLPSDLLQRVQQLLPAAAPAAAPAPVAS